MFRRRSSRQSFRSYFTNWQRDDLTLVEKMRMQIKNSWLRVKSRSNCCGNDGEPGC